MCRKNFGGYWELAHLPESGGFDEQPAPDLELIMKIIDYINLAIHDQKDKKDKR